MALGRTDAREFDVGGTRISLARWFAWCLRALRRGELVGPRVERGSGPEYRIFDSVNSEAARLRGWGSGSGQITQSYLDSGRCTPARQRGERGVPLARRRAPRPTPVTRAAGVFGFCFSRPPARSPTPQPARRGARWSWRGRGGNPPGWSAARSVLFLSTRREARRSGSGQCSWSRSGDPARAAPGRVSLARARTCDARDGGRVVSRSGRISIL